MQTTADNIMPIAWQRVNVDEGARVVRVSPQPVSGGMWCQWIEDVTDDIDKIWKQERDWRWFQNEVR